ncbi:phosphate-starvation-inducible PsiE family protein [Vagococcus sp.]|uniref:phosphate-starvation-inducible PsiE family protein n=1 Tax=Vagococcus sp. TaxID=1933889 RepID=UPI003F9DA446
MLDKYKYVLTKIVDLFLVILSLLIIIYMAQDLFSLRKVIVLPEGKRSIEIVADYILSFFMLFEFIMMILKYIEDSHHIPIKYLIWISMTAILRQLLVVHDNGLQTLMLTISIFVLILVVYIFEVIKRNDEIKKKKDNDK